MRFHPLDLVIIIYEIELRQYSILCVIAGLIFANDLASFRHRPPAAMHVEEVAKGLILLWIRTKSQHISVRILHLHLVCPRKICRRLPNCRSGSCIFGGESIRVVYANPSPRSRTTLVLFAEKNAAASRETGAKPPVSQLTLKPSAIT